MTNAPPSAGPRPAPDSPHFENPVHPGYFADPFVLRTDSGYVAYGTGRMAGGRVFEVLTSPDLHRWTSVGGALVPVDAGLGSDYWAPEVAEHEGAYYLYYSLGHGDRGHHLRVATSGSPLGPFTDHGVNLTPGEIFAIDAHPFQDVDGSWYLFYARDVLNGDRVGTMLAVDALDGMTVLAGKALTIVRPAADWQLYQRNRLMYGKVLDWHTLEGPCVRRRGGRYYCLYSAGSWQNESYAVSWAVAEHPLGPWRQTVGRRQCLLETTPGRLIGPGHNSIVTTETGKDHLVFHAWDPDHTARRMYVSEMTWDRDGPRLVTD